MKKLLATILALVMALSLCSVSWATEYNGFVKGEKGANGMDTYSVDVTSQEQLQAAVKATDCFGANMIINIKNDITITGSWEPGYINGYGKSGKAGTGVVTVNGNGNKIIGLSDMLFSGSWAGKCALIVNDLTIANANIKVEKDDETKSKGVGAFLGSAEATTEVVFSNCHLVASHVEGGHWTGGFVGYSAGYSGDGSVFQTVKFTGCTVSGSTLTGKGSVGALMGHATGNAWTSVEVKNTSVTANEVTSTGSSDNKAGALFGTTGAAGTEKNGKTGGIVVEAVVEGNTVKSNGTPVTTIYGRQGSSEGKLELTGGCYDKMPIAEGDASWAAPNGSLAMAEVTGESGKITYNYGTDYIQAAATAEGVKTIIIKNGDVQLTGVNSGVTVKNTGEGKVTVNGTKEVKKGDAPYTVPTKTSGGYYYYPSTPGITAELNGTNKSATDYPGGDYGLVFRSTAAFSTFQGVQVDGKTLAKSNYTAEEGSTVVYLKAAYLKTLAAGKHTITILSTAGNTSMDFTIGGKSSSPQTFDAGVGIYTVTAVLSVTGMAWTAKKRH